jgi:tetratricopeptide (TPR) repeat protein
LVFGQTVRYGFINYDDDRYVFENPQVVQGLNLKGIEWAFTHSVLANWHPLTMMSHMLDCQFYGLHAGGHHLTNLLLHAATAILLFLILRRMTAALWSSAFVAALFAIHPLRVESVAWVAERKDVLSGLFFMLTLGAYVRFVEKSIARSPKFKVYYGLTLFFFALGLMCKPMLVTVPFVLLLLDYWPLNRLGAVGDRLSIARTLITEKIPLIAFSIAMCMVTFLVQPQDKGIPFFLRIGNAFVSYVAYCRQMFYPAGLAVFYPYPIHGLPMGKILLALMLLVVVSTGAFCWRQKHPHFLMGWLWYLGMLVPVIGLVQVGGQARADRYTYLPQIGLYIFLTWTVVELTAGWRSRRWMLGGGATVVLAVLITCARAQTAYWRDDKSLWAHTLACTSDNSIAHNKLGNALLQHGQLDEAIAQLQMALAINPDSAGPHYGLGNAFFQRGQLDEAIAHYQKALTIDPDNADNHNNLGNAFFQQGQLDKAIASYKKALTITPLDAKVHNNLGIAFRQQGRLEDAIAQFEKAREINPAAADTYNNLGAVLAQQGRMDEAIACFQKTLEIKPDYADARYNLGNSFLQQGHVEEALAQYQKTLEIKPDHIGALNNLAWVLATSPRASLRNGIMAIRLAERANQLAGGKDPEILATLAAAYAEAGNFPKAIETVQSALHLPEAQSTPAAAGALQSQLKLYQTGNPLHGTEQAP